jgi:hypothetical protein
MKFISILFALSLLSCSQLKLYRQDSQLPKKEIEEIKREIIKRAEKQENDLSKLDYKEIMTFYANVDDFIIFGDGYYWGDYITIDNIWKRFTKNYKENTWEFSNPKIRVFTKDIASLLVEFDHKRITLNGENQGGHGCFSFGMQRIDRDWKVVTMHVTHNYYSYDENATFRKNKWWIDQLPENRDKKK